MRNLQHRLQKYLLYCFEDIGRIERKIALASYLNGLLLDGERKSMVPIAARIAEHPDQVQAIRQRLQQAVTVASWDEDVLFKRIALRVEQDMKGIEAFTIDDTGFPKKGTHSVGVQRQYSGTLGRKDNCQVATSLHLASEQGGACIGMRLYLPKSWADDPKRREKVGVPDDVIFKQKWRLAVDMLDKAIEWELPKRVVLADAGYGDSTEFRRELKSRDLSYLVGVTGTAIVWTPGQLPTPPPQHKGSRGATLTRWTDGDAEVVEMRALVRGLARNKWRKVSWRHGSKGRQSSRFVRLRVRTAHLHGQGAPPGEEQWLLAEWPKNEKVPTKFWLSNLPSEVSLRRLVFLAKLRWRIERDYQEMKGELGLDHFEGRGWLGFHHHVACVAAAHAFLTLERVLFPPEQADADGAEVSFIASTGLAVLAGSLPDVWKTSKLSGSAKVSVADVIK